MSQPTFNPLLQAADHLQAGRIDQARAVLIEFVRQYPSSEKGWLMLARTLTEPKQQIECLQRALKINPNNAESRDWLTKLTQPVEPATDAPPPTAPPPDMPKVSPFSTAGLRAVNFTTPPPDAPAPQPTKPLSQPTPSPQPDPSPLEKDWNPGRDLPAPAPVKEEWESALRQGNSAIAPAGTPAKAARPTAASKKIVAAQSKAPARADAAQASQQILIIGIVAVVGLVLLFSVIGGYMALQRQRASEVVVTRQAAIVYASAVFPTLPPTYTNTPTSTITATPTITPTATRTPVPTPKSPAADVAEEMDTIQAQVADLRGLPTQGELQRFVIEKHRVDSTLEELFFDSGSTRETIDDEARTLTALRLINPTFDLFSYTLSGISDGLGGFYVPWNKRLYVIGSSFNGIERFIYSHEYDHALTDSHFNFADLGVYPTCTRAEQQCDAIRALVEGDATLLMYQWFEQYASPEDVDEILRQQYQPSNRQLPDQFPPPYLYRAAAYPYVEGLNFVQTLYAQGSWAEVNSAYQNLPTTTEQILHPQKYLDGEQAISVDPAALDGVLGPEWRLLKSDSLGEWLTFLLLSYSADLAAQLDIDTGEVAATGWGGDQYQVYYNEGSDTSILIVHWIWDTSDDAGEFKAAMLQYQDQRFKGNQVDPNTGDCWEANAQTSCLFSRDREQLWIIAPEQTLLNNILDRYPNFK